MDRAKRGGRARAALAPSAGAAFALALLIFLSTFPSVVAAEPYAMENIFVTVYEDGSARVKAEYTIDLLFPSVSIELLGTTQLQVVVTDSDGLPMGYSAYPGGITVNTLGEGAAEVAYTTHDLTGKAGKYWTVNFSAPIDAWLAFPAGASVVSLSAIPAAIGSSGGRTALLMPAGEVSATYVLSIVGTEDSAFIAISSAQETIDAVSAAGINVTSAVAALLEATAAFDSGDYVAAEELAQGAGSLALEINATAYQAGAMIATASSAIAKAEAEGRTVGLDDARNLLSQANSQYAAGGYQAALASATGSNSRAIAAQTPLQAYLPYIAFAGAGAVAVAAGLLVRSRGRKQGSKGYVKESHEVDLARIAREGQLREDDFKMMEVLAENGGEAFESAVREKFDLPKTTIWRMAKRLEKDGYITIETVAGQNLLRARQEYLKDRR